MALFKIKGKELTQRVIPTLISAECVIHGDMTSGSFVRIDGQLVGNLVISEGLIVGEEGTVQGNIKTSKLVIYGNTTGNIHAEHVEIKSSGKVTGKIDTKELIIETGAVYNGIITMESLESEKKLTNSAQPAFS